MKVILEEVKSVRIGDVVILDKSKVSFKNPVAQNIINTNHMFVVTSKAPIEVCSISSNMKQICHPANVRLIDWDQAGLRKESFVSTNTSGTIELDQIYRKVGSLSNDDLLRVMRCRKSQDSAHVKLEFFN